MDEIYKRTVSKMFAIPVDPERDNCPNYFSIIPKPMDLGTVRKKLEENQYTTIAEWKSDMELIWANSFTFNKNNVLLNLITTEMSDVYKKLAKFVSDDPKNDWNLMLCHLKDQIVLSTKPFEETIGKRIGKSAIKPKSTNKQLSNLTKSPKTKKKSVNKKPLSKNAIVKLTKQINSLTDESQILSILEVIEEEEPQIKAEGEHFELELCSLKPSTLIALRDRLQSLLGPTLT